MENTKDFIIESLCQEVIENIGVLEECRENESLIEDAVYEVCNLHQVMIQEELSLDIDNIVDHICGEYHIHQQRGTRNAY